MPAEIHEFQTEVKQLLDLMIHSLYSHKEVFLRELISNASDATDKRNFEALTDASLLSEAPAEIQLTVDPEARSLTVEDRGIGMSREEVIRNIGTIAHSGTGEFLQALEAARRQEGSPDLIGQFGVGFYASFMVADRVTLVTRRAGEEAATRWDSRGDGSYEIEDATRDEAGTTVTLHLKEPAPDDGLEDYCDAWVLRRIAKRYSDFVSYPIRLTVLGAEEKEGDAEPLNSMQAIWAKAETDVSEEEYKEFYKHISHDWNDPLLHLRARIEGNFDAKALLYVPGTAPFDLHHRDATNRGIQLYVKRVFIMDECRELMPIYLRFVKGVVEAEDLPLNVSREMLQQDRQIQTIRKHLVKKVLESLSELRDQDRERFLTFWGEFGAVLKEGLLAFDEKPERLLDLMLASSTHNEGDPENPTTLAEYVERMGEDQEAIYYLTGENRDQILRSPHLEAFRSKGIEVLLFTDPVDEVWLQQAPPEFQAKRWQSVGRGEVELGSDEEKQAADEERKTKEATFGSLLTALRAAVQDEVKEVRLSNRLTDSAACLVLDEGDVTPQMQELLRRAGQEVPTSKPILEINPGHPLLERLREIADADGTDPRIPRYGELIFTAAVLAEGGQPADPAAFGRQLSDLMLKAL